MSTINFQPWKADGVMRGKYTQTIRRTCDRFFAGRKLTLYCGQRTQKCYKLGEGVCLGTEIVKLTTLDVYTEARGWLNEESREQFAKDDGFKNYRKMWEFFLDRYYLAIEQEYPQWEFHGFRIWWRLDKEAQKNCIKNFNRLKREGGI